MEASLNQLIVQVIRATGWTLEYTRELLQETLDIGQLQEFIQELQHQEQLDSYQQLYGHALIVATLATLLGKEKVEPKDVIGPPPRRGGAEQPSNLGALAKAAGIIIPTKGEL